MLFFNSKIALSLKLIKLKWNSQILKVVNMRKMCWKYHDISYKPRKITYSLKIELKNNLFPVLHESFQAFLCEFFLVMKNMKTCSYIYSLHILFCPNFRLLKDSFNSFVTVIVVPSCKNYSISLFLLYLHLDDSFSFFLLSFSL